MSNISLAAVLKVSNFIKKGLQHWHLPLNIPNVLETDFL